MDILQLVMALVVFLLMLGLGATVTSDDGKRAMLMWKAPLVAMCCQYGIMPLLAFGLAMALQVPKLVGLSMLIVGCSPGGVTSNLYSYYSRADLPLSILATVMSTLTALGFMPLMLFIYSSPFTDDSLTVPYGKIMLSLVLVVVPVAIGAAVRCCHQVWAKRLEIFSSTLGVLFIVTAIVVGNITDAHVYREGWEIWVAAVIMLPVGSASGYLLSRFVARLPLSSCRTICLETGLQNSTLSLAVLAFAFPGDDDFKTTAAFPLAYSLCATVEGSLLTVLFRRLTRDEGSQPKTPIQVDAPKSVDTSVDTPKNAHKLADLGSTPVDATIEVTV
jgi:BASS family bile acid:Na+ symporter